jgi:predicted TIM-barrel fold metal-dependent hydrolase
MTALDVSAIPVLDQHCHPFVQGWASLDLEAFRACFTEGRESLVSHVPALVYYRWALREMRRVLGLPEAAAEEQVLAARARDAQSYLAALLQETTLDGMLLDDGYPPGNEALSVQDMSALCGCPAWRILRLETLLQTLLLRASTLDELQEMFDAELADLRARGVVGLKSILAYRGGLEVREPEGEAVRQAFTEARKVIVSTGYIRLAGPAASALLHAFLYRALRQSAQQGLPLQFHTGFGDTDLDLLTSNPLLLRPLIHAAQEHPLYRGAQIVLLHAGYPYTRQAAYLAAVYPHVSVDVSLAIPFLAGLAPDIWRELLALAPATKILYGADGSVIPEHGWLGAILGRRSLAEVLGQLAEAGMLSRSEARQSAEHILRGNARMLYQLG